MTQIRGTQIKTDSIPSTKLEELDKFTIGLIGTTVYAANGSFTPDPDTVYLVVEVVGGGGGGGGAGTASSAGGGGGGGGYARKRIAVGSLSVPETVTVGAGGGGGASGDNDGTDGGTSSFGVHCSATGGERGRASNNVGFISAPGGSGSGGDINITGGSGWSNLNPPSSTSSAGGSVPLGLGAGGAVTHGQRNSGGWPGVDYGGGGGGARMETSARAGGAGGDGVVLVHEYGVTSS